MPSLGFGGKCAKYTLFVFNLIVVLFGLALLAIGIYVLADSNAFIKIGIADDPFHLVRGAAITVLVIGLASFVVGLVGCWGAVCEKTSCLNCYACITVVLILGEILAIILAGVYHSEIKDRMKDILVHDYTNSPNNSITWAWNHLQEMEKCCGVDGPYDWLANSHFNKTVPVPDSCCTNDTQTQLPLCYADALKNETTADHVYQRGCAFYIEWMKGHMAVLIAFAVILLLAEVILIALTCCLKANISRGYEFV